MELIKSNSPLTVLQIAMVCHQANKAWCEAHEDFSQENWHEARTWQRQKAINRVICRVGNPNKEHDAQSQHNAWLEDKKKNGWVYGEVKDFEAKTHPCIVTFDELPEYQKKKDALFCAIVDCLSSGKMLTVESIE